LALQGRGGENHIIEVPRIANTGKPHEVGQTGVSDGEERNKNEEQPEGTRAAPCAPDANEQASQRCDGPCSTKWPDVR